MGLKVNDISTPSGSLPTLGGVGISPYGFKNYIINGGFDVWQRGTAAVSGDGYYSADRWSQEHCTIEKEVDEVGKPFAKCTCSDDDTFNRIIQRIENGRQFSNKTLTVSFEIDSPDGLEDGRILIYTKDDDDNSYTVRDTNFQYTDTRTMYSFTCSLDDRLLRDDYYLGIYIYGDRTDTNQNGKVFNVYNVQLEEGSVATPFEMRPYGLELSLCQRYYEKTDYYIQDVSGDIFYNTSKFNTTKRANPSITIIAYSGTVGKITNINDDVDFDADIYINGTSAATVHSDTSDSDNENIGYLLILDAEL